MLHWLPESISTYGGDIDHVIRTVYWIVGAWFLLAEAILLFFIIRYRARPGVPAAYQPGKSLKAIAWILVPVTLVLGFDLAIDFVQGPVWNRIKIDLPELPDQRVRIVGRQYVWEITHAGPDGLLDTADDIPALNEVTVPVDSKILFELRSADVLHSLWIPHLRLKQDVVPGRSIPGWFEATKTGRYPIACAELCGSGHGMMRAQLVVLSPADYARWLKGAGLGKL